VDLPFGQRKRIGLAVIWRKVYDKEKPNHYCIPFKGHSAAEDLKKFTRKKNLIL